MRPHFFQVVVLDDAFLRLPNGLRMLWRCALVGGEIADVFCFVPVIELPGKKPE